MWKSVGNDISMCDSQNTVAKFQKVFGKGPGNEKMQSLYSAGRFSAD
jgi:hypothetical protein